MKKLEKQGFEITPFSKNGVTIKNALIVAEVNWENGATAPADSLARQLYKMATNKNN